MMTAIAPGIKVDEYHVNMDNFKGVLIKAKWSLLTVVFFMISGCASLKQVDLPDETAMSPADAPLWSALSLQRAGSWFELLNTGVEAIEWRLRMIDSATRSLDIQTFLWKADPSGLTILGHIVDAADRGVKVRLLVDDTFTVGQNDTIFFIDQHPNIKYRIYNPFGRRYDSMFLRQLMNLGNFSRLDHRMHNKVLVTDNRAAIIGGRNMADEYFGSHPRANFRDVEVLAYGPIVQSISQRFDAYWNNDWSLPVDQLLDQPVHEQAPSDFTKWLLETADRGLDEDEGRRRESWHSAASASVTGDAIILSDEPATDSPDITDEAPDQLSHELIAWMDQAKEELIIVSAYLIPTPELETAIERAEDRGVRVRILTNSLQSNNHTAAHSAYRHHLHRLILQGADLHEVRAMAKDRSIYMQGPVDGKTLGLHAKLILIDQELTFIGSANLDPRSLHLNTEIGLMIQSYELNQRLREKLEIDFHKRNAWHLHLDDSKEIVWVADDVVRVTQPADSAFQRLEDWFLSILPIEEEM